MDDNCINCLFSSDDKTSLMIEELLKKHNMGGHSKSMLCNHPNSPYFEERVNDKISCRQFEDCENYFKMQDRFRNIEELKNNIQKKKLGL